MTARGLEIRPSPVMRDGAQRAAHSGRALRMVFVLDVAGYGKRTVPDRDAVQQRLQRLVVATLAECGLTLGEGAVDHQWTGDGINGVLPPTSTRRSCSAR